MFFEPSSFSERKLSMDYFREWAGQIANSYLSGGTVPTDSLCKIASQEELTPHQIEILAAETNKEIHRIKYASAKEKYFAADFPLADAKRVITSLQADGGEMKVASHMPEPKFSDARPSPFEMFRVKPEVLDKTASVKHQLKVASVRGELLEQKASDKLLLSKYASEAAEHSFIKQARQMVLGGGNSSERLRLLGAAGHFVKSAGFSGVGRKPLAKLAYVLGREGLLEKNHATLAAEYFLKEADCKVPQEMISEWLTSCVVNGNHPLYITLKTLNDRQNEVQELCGQGKLIQDRLKIVRQKVRAL